MFFWQWKWDVWLLASRHLSDILQWKTKNYLLTETKLADIITFSWNFTHNFKTSTTYLLHHWLKHGHQYEISKAEEIQVSIFHAIFHAFKKEDWVLQHFPVTPIMPRYKKIQDWKLHFFCVPIHQVYITSSFEKFLILHKNLFHPPQKRMN